ncbi:hypothetical protein GN244_ATG15452 [Phytophthora infestans]|uniref:Crinkler effector protein N-terminal domain-containing protein n=1 Tax=Phytophthora infestans TaxID=4787 RepID=A0A833T2J0_PHYIN|nr:hypothetical protein GN244_ATG15452 [Phytophthora infestans]
MVVLSVNCVVVRSEIATTVVLDENSTVAQLQSAIAAQFKFPDAAYKLDLFLAKDGGWLDMEGVSAVALDQYGYPQRFHRMKPLRFLKNAEYFGEGFQVSGDEVHVLVVAPTSVSPSLRQQVLDGRSLQELWSFSELDIPALPFTSQLKALLQRPLPFKLALGGSVDVPRGLFEPTGELISCPQLTGMINAFLSRCTLIPDATASENSWQAYYDSLLLITTCLCRAKCFDVREYRNQVDKSRSTKPRKRPDFILEHDGLVLMRGEEKNSLASIEMSTRELTNKMCQWNVLLYGDLPYILGYATSGQYLQVVAIEKSGRTCRPTALLPKFSILQDKTVALKLFYNLAFFAENGELGNSTVYV